MNNLKAILCVALSIMLLLLSSFCFPVFASETNENYEQLLALGFSENFLNCCTEEMQQRIISYIDGREIAIMSSNSNNDHELLSALGLSDEFLNCSTEVMQQRVVPNTDGHKIVNMSNNSDNSYDQLLALGFPEDLLDCISDKMQEKIISYVDGNTVLDVLYNNDTTSYEDIDVKSVNVSYKDNSNEQAMGECVIVYWEWKTGKPLVRQNDYLRIYWYNSKYFYAPESFYAEDYSIDENNISILNTYTTLSEIIGADEKQQHLISYWSDLKYTGGQIGGCAVFALHSQYDESSIGLENRIKLDYNHYYSTTVIISILIVCAIVAFVVAITVVRKKNGNKKKK